MAFEILVVDDSATIRSVLKKTLMLTGLDIGEIHLAANGKEALEKLNETWIDLVVSDLNMPEMTGEELINEIVKDNTLKSIPVVVISTEGSTTRIEALKELGIREYIRKPFAPETVGETIARVLGVKNE